MKIGLKVAEVKQDENNPRFSLRGYLNLAEEIPFYVWVDGYIGMHGNTLHLDNISTLRVNNQAKILEYVAENEKKILRSVKRKLAVN